MASILQQSPSSLASVDQREKYLDAAKVLFAQAQVAAEEGNVSGSAALILKALDQERRAGGVGPQVMQLIKPRG